MDLQCYFLLCLILFVSGVGATLQQETGINGTTVAEKSVVCEADCYLPIRGGRKPQMLWSFVCNLVTNLGGNGLLLSFT